MQKMIAIVCATNRADNAQALLDNIAATAAAPHGIEVVFCADEGDESIQQVDNPSLDVTTLVFPKGCGVGQWWNGGYSMTEAEIVMFMPDDVTILAYHWDTDLIVEALQRRIQLIHVNDTIFGPRLCTMPAARREVWDAVLKHTMGYKRYRIDDHIHHIFHCLRVLGHDRIRYLGNIRFEHRDYIEIAGQRIYRPAASGIPGQGNDAVLYKMLLNRRKADAFHLAMEIDQSSASRVAEQALMIEELTDYFSEGV